MVGVIRRWYILLLTFFIICASGLSAVWYFKEPVYHVTGAIRIAPILADILTNTKDKGDISDYEIFMNTQAELIKSDQVLQRVADDLQNKELSFFENEAVGLKQKLKQLIKGTEMNPELVWLLKQAISRRAIVVGADSDTELIKINVISLRDDEAKQIVDSFINNAMAVGRTNSTQGEDLNLSLLDAEKKDLEEEIEYTSQAIHRLAEKYGTDTLTGRQEMMLQRITALQSELIKTESLKADLEAEVMLLERTEEGSIPADELLKMRQNFINGDPSVVAFARSIAEVDQMLIVADQTFTPINQKIKQQEEIYETMKERLVELKEEAGKAFDELLAEEIDIAGESNLVRARAQLEHIIEKEKLLRETIKKEDSETIKLGQMQLEIESLQDKSDIYKQRYEAVLQRIQDLELQKKRPARMSVHYYAQTQLVQDQRVKYSAGIMFVGLIFGMWFAYLRDKADKRLWLPEDASKRIGIKIIGTTTSLHAVKPSLLPEQIIEDYQTIRANLELSSDEGIPRILVVTSPGMREGKTTFSVNLATSLAEAGKRVLLIDGDLRKPDVARLLNLPKDLMGLQNVLSGVQIERAVYSMPSTGLDVLAADYYDPADGYELLALPSTADMIKKISKKYDHVIIDTPPALSFPDALMWAKIGNAVVLTSFAGQTTFPDLREAKERLVSLDIKVLGAVVTSVEAEHSYYRHSPAYYAQRSRARRIRRKTLLSYDN